MTPKGDIIFNLSPRFRVKSMPLIKRLGSHLLNFVRDGLPECYNMYELMPISIKRAIENGT